MRLIKLASLFWLGLCLTCFADINDFQENIGEKSVTFVNSDGTTSASISLMDPIVNLSTTKDYAQHVMDNYQGWGLKAVLDLRGFAFNYVDNAPCSGLITYFDGRSYLFFQSCGKISTEDLKKLYERGDEILKLSDLLKLQGHPNLY